jgi:hypothetical protein
MGEPRYKRFLKKCEEFLICSEVGDGDVIVAEHACYRDTLYQIIVYGTGKVCECFDNKEIEFKRGIIDVKKFRKKHTNFYSYEPFLIYGFNTLEDSHDWNVEEIKGSFTCNQRGWLICFDGHPIVNGKELKRMDYSLLEIQKDYNIDIKDGLLGFFYRI